ncbi:MAG: serine/threonine protein kinase, partial [Acidobacteriaceae bacterium]|nr:serine/threonine protein kinase [Acidobacteriaceae bacterium]
MSNKIGRFEIVSEITHTEATSVYKATDSESNQTVALKVIHLAPLGEQAPALVKSILDEAEASKVLNSHNIALLYGAGEIDGNLCASMEYVQGNSVGTMLARREGFSIWDLQDIARQSCQGLDHAHTRKIFHCALEPAKIMVQWDGIVKILGFGVSTSGLYASQARGKSPELLYYMSPEQLNGDPVDARSNLFSLGAILYEMVTEMKAFAGEDADQVRQAILEAIPAAPDQINRKVHPGLSAVIMKALAKAPEDRYQNGQELVNDLEKCKENPAKAAAPKPAAKAPAKAAPVPAAPRARAATAGVGGNSPAKSVTVGTPPATLETADVLPSNQPAVRMSAAAAATQTETPNIAVDPMMDESRQAATQGRSFSDIDELPPLKEVYVAPSAPVSEEQPEPATAMKAVVFDRAALEKPKVNPGEIAKKAVGELKQTPPHLFIYSIAAAAVIILLVVAGIAYHIHSGESDDDSAPQATAAAAKPTPAPAPPVAPPPVTQPEQAAPPAPVVNVPEIQPEPVQEAPSPRSAPTKHARVKKPARIVKPATPGIVAGQVSIDSSPQGAQITIDGKKVASVTPFNVADLLPGHHTIVIGKLGYATETRTLDVASGSKSVISVQLAA